MEVQEKILNLPTAHRIATYFNRLCNPYLISVLVGLEVEVLNKEQSKLKVSVFFFLTPNRQTGR